MKMIEQGQIWRAAKIGGINKTTMKNINIDSPLIEVLSGEHYLTIKWNNVKLMIPNTDVPQKGISLRWADEQLRNCIKSYPDLTAKDQNIGLCIVSLEALKDKHYEKYKHLTKRQLTDLLYELKAENTGLKVKDEIFKCFFSEIKL